MSDVSVRYMIDDVPAAVTFYTTLLGFTLEQDASPAFAAVSRGGVRLLLSGEGSSGKRPLADGRRQVPGGWNRIHLQVSDLEAEVKRLRTAGVAFTTASLRSNTAARHLRRLRTTVLASVLAAGVPHHVRAQMPKYWGAAAVGLGAFRAGEPYDAGVLFSGTFSLGRRIAGDAAVSLDGHLLSGPTAEQPPNYPDGSSVRPGPARTLPTTYGLSASGWHAVARGMMVGTGAGAYHIETRFGAPGGTVLGLHAAAECAVVARHRGALTVGVRVVYLPNIGGTSAWLLPVSVGVRAW